MMKKTVAIVMLLAVVLGVAACSKNKNPVYVPPETEVVTLENGSTVVYEVGTLEDGSTFTLPYTPPVTDADGRLVPTEPNTKAAVDNEYADLEGGTPVVKTEVQTDAMGSTKYVVEQTDAKGSTVYVPVMTDAQGHVGVTEKQTNAKGDDILVFVTIPTVPETTKAPGTITETPTELEESETTFFDKDIDRTSEPEIETIAFSKAEANKLAAMLEIDNVFDSDLTDGKFNEAQKSMLTYIADAKTIQTKVSQNPTYLQIVGKDNLNNWVAKLNEAKPLYDEFIKVSNSSSDVKEKQKSYIEFQTVYKQALVSYFNMTQAVDVYRYN